ncbi:MAG TPA: HAMP domain-containing sensor histidine kinase [Syntrophomonadaceae bacterium]|nr:HAMP domain-containing sensor histidine kinase [Syntrophomonadaceae bacterium]
MKIRIKSITSKILISYLVVVICSTAITTFSFHSILFSDLERRVRSGLFRQARDMSFSIQHEGSGLITLAEVPHRKSSPGLFPDQTLESQYIVTDPKGIIVYSTVPEQFPVEQDIQKLAANQQLNYLSEDSKITIPANGSFMAVQVPIGLGEDYRGTVISFAEVSALEALNRDILFILLKSLFIAIAIAIPLALLLGRYLVKPLNSLRDYAKAIARRRFDVRLHLKSDDEFSELASTFNEMAVQLERYDLSTRRFYQSASHELKTPLMSIQGFTEGIRDGVFSGEQAERALEMIAKECQRLKAIVDEMIDVNKQQAQEVSYNLLPCDLKQILVEVAESLQGYAIEGKVQIDVNVPDEIRVIGDPEKLRRLFGNLVTNAIRHARSQVTLRGTSKDVGSSISIVVQDDGKGFSQEDLAHAFDFMYKGPDGSTGLGLSISQIIVEELNGTIHVGNGASGGGMVEVTLPFNLS